MNHKRTNRLIGETSPYLLQHAHNPVDWYPWGEEAIERARREDKPILLSVGYSACHWCHVMERESFEDEEIAALMNEHFVNVKVDREERPDLDDIYMHAVQMMTGAGGWPMTVFLTPDLEPFYGGTYFPPEDRHGRPGFKRVLAALSEVYRNRRDEVERSTAQITRNLQALAQVRPSSDLLTEDLLSAAVRELEERFDERCGGFGAAPKFPPSMSLSLLLRVWRKTKQAPLLHMVEKTLAHMARGGMYDHLGGGFHRYSTDERWLIPHFEKMLYDNALLPPVYLEAFQATGEEFYAEAARETLDYVLREMQDPRGPFYSTRDADSEGVEGKFFVWRPAEVREVLGDGADLFCRYYGVTEAGNFEHGMSALHVARPLEEVARELGMSAGEAKAALAEAKGKMFEARERRAKPGLDDKVLTSWNGLMIAALCAGAQVLDDPRYVRAAERAAGFVLAEMSRDGLLLRTHRNGRSKLNAYLDDYAFLAAGLLGLYETTFDLRWLREARRLTGVLLEYFWDEEDGGFFFTGKNHEPLLTRARSGFDGAIPSGNAVAAEVLLRLGVLTGEEEFRKKGVELLRVFRTMMESLPSGFARFFAALDFYLDAPKEIAVLGPPGSGETRKFLREVHRRYLPNKVLALLDPSADAGAAGREVPLLAGKSQVDGKVTVYVCQNYACQSPTSDLDAFAKLLNA
ncbi:MAG: thioredoxin domain-containing protein [Candidatus Tectomicrobia bacterium]|nr:thioredoxin domain-containing protein [Candidatus Tectomicrobia bacterium]